jgi:GST-like protein
MIELYTYDTPNGRKISVALEEMGLPYKVQVVDITKQQQFEPAFLAISPNNKIPAIVDPDVPDGAPISVFESGAILIWLAEKTGRFFGANARERISVLEWLMWQMGGLGPMPGQVHQFLLQPEGPAREFGLTRYGNETKRLYSVLDKRLADRAFVATVAEPSIADFAILGWVWRHERHLNGIGTSLDAYPQVRRWYQAMLARPATARGMSVALK